MSMVSVALAYVADGLPVFPLRTRSNKPWAGSHGFRDATLDPDLVRGWWSGRPHSNIGIATGTPGGIVAVDIDSPAAARALDELAAGRPLDGLIVRTVRGWHRWYRTPGAPVRNSRGRLAPGIDVRGVGGYVVAPPSVRGRRYEFVDGRLDLPPGWLLDALTHAACASSPSLTLAPRREGDHDGLTTPWGRQPLNSVPCGLLHRRLRRGRTDQPGRGGGRACRRCARERSNKRRRSAATDPTRLRGWPGPAGWSR